MVAQECTAQSHTGHLDLSSNNLVPSTSDSSNTLLFEALTQTASVLVEQSSQYANRLDSILKNPLHMFLQSNSSTHVENLALPFSRAALAAASEWNTLSLHLLKEDKKTTTTTTTTTSHTNSSPSLMDAKLRLQLESTRQTILSSIQRCTLLACRQLALAMQMTGWDDACSSDSSSDGDSRENSNNNNNNNNNKDTHSSSSSASRGGALHYQGLQAVTTNMERQPVISDMMQQLTVLESCVQRMKNMLKHSSFHIFFPSSPIFSSSPLCHLQVNEEFIQHLIQSTIVDFKNWGSIQLHNEDKTSMQNPPLDSSPPSSSSTVSWVHHVLSLPLLRKFDAYVRIQVMDITSNISDRKDSNSVNAMHSKSLSTLTKLSRHQICSPAQQQPLFSSSSSSSSVTATIPTYSSSSTKRINIVHIWAWLRDTFSSAAAYEATSTSTSNADKNLSLSSEVHISPIANVLLQYLLDAKKSTTNTTNNWTNTSHPDFSRTKQNLLNFLSHIAYIVCHAAAASTVEHTLSEIVITSSSDCANQHTNHLSPSKMDQELFLDILYTGTDMERYFENLFQLPPYSFLPVTALLVTSDVSATSSATSSFSPSSSSPSSSPPQHHHHLNSVVLPFMFQLAIEKANTFHQCSATFHKMLENVAFDAGNNNGVDLNQTVAGNDEAKVQKLHTSSISRRHLPISSIMAPVFQQAAYCISLLPPASLYFLSSLAEVDTAPLYTRFVDTIVSTASLPFLESLLEFLDEGIDAFNHETADLPLTLFTQASRGRGEEQEGATMISSSTHSNASSSNVKYARDAEQTLYASTFLILKRIAAIYPLPISASRQMKEMDIDERKEMEEDEIKENDADKTTSIQIQSAVSSSLPLPFHPAVSSSSSSSRVRPSPAGMRKFVRGMWGSFQKVAVNTLERWDGGTGDVVVGGESGGGRDGGSSTSGISSSGKIVSSSSSVTSDPRSHRSKIPTFSFDATGEKSEKRRQQQSHHDINTKPGEGDDKVDDADEDQRHSTSPKTFFYPSPRKALLTLLSNMEVILDQIDDADKIVAAARHAPSALITLLELLSTVIAAIEELRLHIIHQLSETTTTHNYKYTTHIITMASSYQISAMQIRTTRILCRILLYIFAESAFPYLSEQTGEVFRETHAHTHLLFAPFFHRRDNETLVSEGLWQMHSLLSYIGARFNQVFCGSGYCAGTAKHIIPATFLMHLRSLERRFSTQLQCGVKKLVFCSVEGGREKEKNKKSNLIQQQRPASGLVHGGGGEEEKEEEGEEEKMDGRVSDYNRLVDEVERSCAF